MAGHRNKLVFDLDQDRKSTRLNSSHQIISYAVFCLKKKKKNSMTQQVTNPNELAEIPRVGNTAPTNKICYHTRDAQTRARQQARSTTTARRNPHTIPISDE